MLKSNVRELMEKKGVSFRELEKISGVTLKTIHRARQHGEGNIESCTLATLRLIANALSVSVKDLFDDGCS